MRVGKHIPCSFAIANLHHNGAVLIRADAHALQMVLVVMQTHGMVVPLLPGALVSGAHQSVACCSSASLFGSSLSTTNTCRVGLACRPSHPAAREAIRTHACVNYAPTRARRARRSSGDGGGSGDDMDMGGFGGDAGGGGWSSGGGGGSFGGGDEAFWRGPWSGFTMSLYRWERMLYEAGWLWIAGSVLSMMNMLCFVAMHLSSKHAERTTLGVGTV